MITDKVWFLKPMPDKKGLTSSIYFKAGDFWNLLVLHPTKRDAVGFLRLARQKGIVDRGSRYVPVQISIPRGIPRKLLRAHWVADWC